MAGTMNQSSTQGGSESHTSSHSVTNTSSHTEGGSHSYSEGKSWASGKIEDNTAEHRNKYNTDYEEGQKVQDTYNTLQELLNNKPTFQSKYEDQLNNIYDQIMNREKFSYDFNADNMYKLYKDNYQAQGKTAMQDTMGQASALTGGYGSSYAQSVGQQTYQNYLQQLNNMIPELRNQAYQEYQDEGSELLNKYNVSSDAYNREYGQYRDDVSDWQSDRSFDYGMYSDERNFDYNKFTNERSYWNDEYWNEKNAEQSNYQMTDTSYWEDTTSTSETFATSDTSSSYWENSASSSVPLGLSSAGTAAKSGSSARLNNQNDTRGRDFYNNNQSNDYSTKWGAFDIKEGDYITQISDSQLNTLINQIASAKNDWELSTIKADMKSVLGMDNAQIGWLEDQVKKRQKEASVTATPTIGNSYLGRW